jgi:predicted aspartyl protease
MNREAFDITIIALAAFGYFYNAFNGWLEVRGYERGNLAMLVAFGCLVTIIGAGNIIGVEAMLIVLACFLASGISMIAGYALRFARQREAQERRSAQNAEVVLERLAQVLLNMEASNARPFNRRDQVEPSAGGD